MQTTLPDEVGDYFVIMRFRSCVAGLLCLFILSACTSTVPLEDLKNFREAFVEAQKAGDLIYDEVAPILAASATKSPESCGVDRAGTPNCFDPDQVVSPLGSRNEDRDIRVRRVALAFLSEYSLTLVELADGKSSEALTGSIQQTAALANALITLAGAAAPAGLPALVTGPVLASFTQFAVRLNNVRAAAEVRNLIVSNEATVGKLIDLLIEDTAPLYAIYYARARIAVLDAPGRSGLDSLEKATAYHKALAAYVLILRQAKLSNSRLASLARSGPSNPGELRAVVEEAIRIKQSAETFWEAVRDVRK